MPEEKQPQYINSVSRAIHVLELYGRQNVQSLGIAEIAKALDLQKTTAFNIVKTLVREGWLVQEGPGGKYRLGTRILRVSTAVVRGMTTEDLILEEMHRLRDKYNEDVVLTAMMGYAGLYPTIRAIKAGKAIALANKETLVVAGELITRLALENRVPIIPVDSEHSAIFQCLAGENDNAIEKIILTASGGPFRTLSAEELKHVTKNEALKHPNWKMGAKITIDSASMMNKGFEVIEAQWLFNVTPDQIEVAVHPQSIVHSMVQFQDGAIKAQLGLPNMKLPIQYAFAYPHRLPSSDPKPRLEHYMSLTFERPDTDRFPLLGYAYEAMRQGGNMPCIMNAANEIVVEAFLHDRIAFTDMPRLIARAMDEVAFVATPTYDDYVATDAEARRRTREWI